jgi:membrane-associated phospholipid phosphatase
MFMSDHGTFGCWHFITRLGEVQLLLPAALWACLALLNQPTTRIVAVRWLQALVLAAGLTLASKIAFIGWGLGSATLNFTGISGHAMCAAAIYPLLTATLTCRLPAQWERAAVILSFVLVMLVCVSRLIVMAHSVSEVVAGFLVGSAVSAYAVGQIGLPRAKLNFYVPLILALWLMVSPLHTPQIPIHSMVTHIALLLSGHIKPHTRTELLHHSMANS